MKPRQKFVRLSEGQILVPPEQKQHADALIEKHNIPMNQYIRDVIQHAMECPFFNGRYSNGGNVSSTEGTGK